MYFEILPMIKSLKDKIIVDLDDVDNLKDVERLVKELAPYVGYFKVGLPLLTSVGAPEVVTLIHGLGGRVFLDGKFNDIPSTVEKASAAAIKLNVEMFNVHASAGIDAMTMAMQTKKKKGSQAIILAITVLSSLDKKNTYHIFGASPEEKVIQLALDAEIAGIDGIICSPQELVFLRKQEKLRGMIIVTPGIRPEWYPTNDQKRTMTPEEAVLAGADFLVIGRPITQPLTGTPVDAVELILEEIKEAQEKRAQAEKKAQAIRILKEIKET